MFSEWKDFYLFIGSAASSLIGLMFVVTTLTAGHEAEQVRRGTRIYMTPTVFHLAVAVMVSAMALSPGLPHMFISIGVAVIGIGGFVYCVRIHLGIRHTPPEQVAEQSDFWSYAVAPAIGYVIFLLSGIAIGMAAEWSAHVLAFAVVALLLISVRNEWDLVTFLAPKSDAPEPPR